MPALRDLTRVIQHWRLVWRCPIVPSYPFTLILIQLYDYRWCQLIAAPSCASYTVSRYNVGAIFLSRKLETGSLSSPQTSSQTFLVFKPCVVRQSVAYRSPVASLVGSLRLDQGWTLTHFDWKKKKKKKKKWCSLPGSPANSGSNLHITTPPIPC